MLDAVYFVITELLSKYALQSKLTLFGLVHVLSLLAFYLERTLPIALTCHSNCKVHTYFLSLGISKVDTLKPDSKNPLAHSAGFN